MNVSISIKYNKLTNKGVNKSMYLYDVLLTSFLYRKIRLYRLYIENRSLDGNINTVKS